MDAFTHSIDLKSRADVLHIYAIGDVHIGAQNFDLERFQKYIKIIKNDKNAKVVFLLGDILDLVVMSDQKRFTVTNFDDESLTGEPKVIRKNLSNLAVKQVQRAIKMLSPIKDCIIGAVKGNHEEAVEKSCKIDCHQMLCEELGVRDCGDVGFAVIKISRNGVGSRAIKVAFMHYASGGRTAGAGNNSLARAMNIFSSDIVFQGHNHSPAVQRIVRIGCTQNNKNTRAGDDGEPRIVHLEQLGINIGSFLYSYKQNTNGYDQAKLFNPKECTLYRVVAKLHETHLQDQRSSTPKFIYRVEEL